MKGSPLSARTATPGVTTASCVIFNTGFQHLMVQRPSIQEMIVSMAGCHGTSNRYAPTIVFKNGESRQVIFGKPKQITAELLEVEGRMANGSAQVKVLLRFTGSSSHSGSMTVGI